MGFGNLQILAPLMLWTATSSPICVPVNKQSFVSCYAAALYIKRTTNIQRTKFLQLVVGIHT
jgi:hypothetical protein